jgi:hypothetical protein
MSLFSPIQCRNLFIILAYKLGLFFKSTTKAFSSDNGKK